MNRTILLASVATAMLSAGAQAAELPQASNAWWTQAKEALAAHLAVEPIVRPAKNVILFVGDGNSVISNTAVRIYEGQKRGMSGEENVLSYEAFPNLALAKTYNTNAQTADSAGTAAAMTTGIKTDIGVLGVTEDVMRGNCQSALDNEVTTIAEMAETIGMATGVVSTARLTHATPASVYAHSADRNWEDNTKLPDGSACKDIAAQLIEFDEGDGIDVAMGGGRRHFLPDDVRDVEGKTGRRTDGRNLADEWAAKSADHVVVHTQAQFDAVDPASGAKVLGLFNSSHMAYEADRANDKGGEPSLAEMTGAAIKLLSGNDQGFFLMVEAGRIDHAHHASNAARALEDGVALHDAVKMANELTSREDTLIVVTADHGHTIIIQGYPQRGNPILGLVKTVNKDGSKADEFVLAGDGKPYTTLSYANGPGSIFGDGSVAAAERADLTGVDTTDVDFTQQSLIPRSSETHGGGDVAIYARGPSAHLIDGTVEQNYIFHVMSHALRLEDRLPE